MSNFLTQAETSSHYMYIQSNVETFLPGSGEKCRSVFLGSAVEHFESSNKLKKRNVKVQALPLTATPVRVTLCMATVTNNKYASGSVLDKGNDKKLNVYPWTLLYMIQWLNFGHTLTICYICARFLKRYSLERKDSLMNLITSEGWASNQVSLNNDICRPRHCFTNEHTL